MTRRSCSKKRSLIFIDTSALFAAFVSSDRNHRDARRAEEALRTAHEQFWTIDAVLIELWLLLAKRAGLAAADTTVRGLLERGIEREPITSEDYARAWQIAREWPDQRFSLTDRQAFVVMDRTRRYGAWSYDDDFATIRLGPARRRAIDLVR